MNDKTKFSFDIQSETNLAKHHSQMNILVMGTYTDSWRKLT